MSCTISKHDELPVLYETALVIHPSYLAIYPERHYTSGNNTSRARHNVKAEVNKSNKYISTASKKKCKKAIDYLVYTSSTNTAYNNKTKRKFNFKLAFVTLTLSAEQQHANVKLKADLLHQFLTEAKKKWNVSKYVWRQEYQPKSGNWHIHILVDKFIPYLELRNTWNRIQNKLNYHDTYKQTFNKESANSTDIHSVKKIQDIAKYVTKYMTKDERKRTKISRSKLNISKQEFKEPHSVSKGALNYLKTLQQEGRLWSCSQNLSNITGAKSYDINKFSEELERMSTDKSCKRIDKEHFSVIYFNNSKLNIHNYPLLFELFTKYVYSTFDFSTPCTIWNEEPPPITKMNYN